MKKNNLNRVILLIKFSIMSILLMISCDKGFVEMNTNPNAFTEPIVTNLFSYAQIRTVGSGTADRNRTNIKHMSGAMQYFSTLTDYWYGEKGVVHEQNGNFFETVYTSHLRELSFVLSETENNPDQVNLNAMAKIWKIFALHRVTDAYGDVPYKDALQGMSGVYKPKYDKQSDIYPWMLADLEAAINQLDGSKSSIGAADVIFGGSIDKWKSFGYSLMLRLGMRLTKVDQSMAETWVKKAIAGGVIDKIDDQALLKHTSTNSNNWNWDAYELKRESLSEGSAGLGLIKMGETFMELLHAHNDPRIPFYATLWEGNINSKQLEVISETTKPELQKGLPHGYLPSTISQAIPTWASSMLTTYSEPNTATMANYSAPTIILSLSEVEFLLAEAVLRGWKAGDAETHYHNGIRANMESSYLYPNFDIEPMYLTDVKIDAYIAAHPLTGTDQEKMQQIHLQTYFAFYMYTDFFEAFSTWRRTGVPALQRINYILNTTDGYPIRRLRYSNQELALNEANVEAAIAAMGGNTLSTRVWWDKE